MGNAAIPAAKGRNIDYERILVLDNDKPAKIWFSCKLCNLPISARQGDMKRHMGKHNGTGILRCDLPGCRQVQKEFFQQVNKDAHMLTDHHPDSQYACPHWWRNKDGALEKCSIVRSTEKTLRDHRRNIHGYKPWRKTPLEALPTDEEAGLAAELQLRSRRKGKLAKVNGQKVYLPDKAPSNDDPHADCRFLEKFIKRNPDFVQNAHRTCIAAPAFQNKKRLSNYECPHFPNSLPCTPSTPHLSQDHVDSSSTLTSPARDAHAFQSPQRSPYDRTPHRFHPYGDPSPRRASPGAGPRTVPIILHPFCQDAVDHSSTPTSPARDARVFSSSQRSPYVRTQHRFHPYGDPSPRRASPGAGPCTVPIILHPFCQDAVDHSSTPTSPARDARVFSSPQRSPYDRTQHRFHPYGDASPRRASPGVGTAPIILPPLPQGPPPHWRNTTYEYLPPRI